MRTGNSGDVTSRVLVVTPTYNERQNLGPFLEGVFGAVPNAHVLVVDDASPDGTGELADRFAAKDPRIRVAHRPRKMGLGSAYLDAFREGLGRNYELFVEMDTDLSHDPRYLPGLLEATRQADVVIGSRNIKGGGIEGWGLGRRILSKGGSLYSRVILSLAVRDLTSGYKVFRRQVLEAIDLDSVASEGYSFQIELTFRAVQKGFRVREIPIVFVDRRAGQSKMSGHIFIEAVAIVWKLRYDSLCGRL